MVPAASRRQAGKKTLQQVPDQEQAGDQGKGIGEEMIQGEAVMFMFIYVKIHIL